MAEAIKLVVVDEYDGEYFINDAYRPIAQKLKDKFTELQHVPVKHILFMDRQNTKQKHGNRTVCAQVSKIPARFHDIIYQLTGKYFTFMIEIFKMNTAHMSRGQIVALLYHEMRHIQLVGDEFKIVGHDIEDWANMIEKLGVDWNTTKRTIPDLLDDDITDWNDIEGPLTLFPAETTLKVVK